MPPALAPLLTSLCTRRALPRSWAGVAGDAGWRSGETLGYEAEARATANMTQTTRGVKDGIILASRKIITATG